MRATASNINSLYMAPMFISGAEKERHKYGKIFTADHIIKKMCDVWGINPEELSMKSRKREYVEYRAALTIFIINHTDIKISLVKLGSLFNRDHATLIHYLKAYTHHSFVNVNKMVHQIKNNMRYIRITKLDDTFDIWVNAKKVDLEKDTISEDMRQRIYEKIDYMNRYRISDSVIKI